MSEPRDLLADDAEWEDAALRFNLREWRDRARDMERERDEALASVLHDIGTPRAPVTKWLRDFAADCRIAFAVTPWRRAYLRGRAEAFDEAADLVVRAARRDDGLPFPMKLAPGQAVSFEVPLYPTETA